METLQIPAEQTTLAFGMLAVVLPTRDDLALAADDADLRPQRDALQILAERQAALARETFAAVIMSSNGRRFHRVIICSSLTRLRQSPCSSTCSLTGKFSFHSPFRSCFLS